MEEKVKARVKTTGEIFDIEGVSLRLTGKVLSTFGLDEVEILMPDLTPDYWTRLEHQAAIGAMRGLLQNEKIMCYAQSTKGWDDFISNNALEFATALVEKLKKKEE